MGRAYCSAPRLHRRVLQCLPREAALCWSAIKARGRSGTLLISSSGSSSSLSAQEANVQLAVLAGLCPAAHHAGVQWRWLEAWSALRWALTLQAQVGASLHCQPALPTCHPEPMEQVRYLPAGALAKYSWGPGQRRLGAATRMWGWVQQQQQQWPVVFMMFFSRLKPGCRRPAMPAGRVPAGLNGIVGIKPSVGRFSTTGVVPACYLLDCVSVFALTVEDGHEVATVMENLNIAGGWVRARGKVVAGMGWPEPNVGDLSQVGVA